MYRDVVGQLAWAFAGERGSREPQVMARSLLEALDVVVFAAPCCFGSFFVINSLALRLLVLSQVSPSKSRTPGLI